jgi:hypothetical protein
MTDGQTNRRTDHTDINRQTSHIDRPIDRYDRDRLADRHTGRHNTNHIDNRQTRQTDRHTYRQTDRQTEIARQTNSYHARILTQTKHSVKIYQQVNDFIKIFLMRRDLLEERNRLEDTGSTGR